ncbi:hypothetical protein PENTCL1PPCAC_2756, partial [Pristionchus entomophagus]
MEKLREHHEEGIDERVMKILREYEGTRAQLERNNEEEVSREKEEKREEWRREQERDKWSRETREKVRDAELGHAGSKKLYQLLKREFMWGGLEKDVAAIVGKCTRCRLSNAQKRFVPQLVPRVVKEPLEMVAIDLLDLGRGLNGGSMQLLMKKTHTEVNERLKEEREKMKRQYDEKNRFRKNDEPKIGDRVYVKKEIRGE